MAANSHRTVVFLATVTGIGKVLVAKRRSVVTFGLALGRRVSIVSTITRIGGSLSQNAEQSSDLDSRLIAVSKVAIVTGIRRVLVAKRRSVVTSWSPRLNSVNNHKDRGGPCHKTQICRQFGLAFGRRVLKVATVTRIGRVLVAKRRSVVTSWSPHVKSVNNHKDRGGPCRKTQNSRQFWTRPWSQSGNNHRDRGVLVAKRRSVVTFGLAFGQPFRGAFGKNHSPPSSRLTSLNLTVGTKQQTYVVEFYGWD